jgi:uncharacterized protein
VRADKWLSILLAGPAKSPDFPMLRLILLLAYILAASEAASLPNQRPDVNNRTFTSKAIDELITQLTPLFNDNNLAVLFSNCLPNTLDTTISSVNFDDESDPDAFIITGKL